MKVQFYSIIIIFIITLVCSSCSITRQTTCPTIISKTEKIRKPLFSKKSSSKKKKQQFTKKVNQTKKQKKQHISFPPIEMEDIIASTRNDITLNLTNITSSFIESKRQKFIYKKVEKKAKKNLKNLEKHNQKGVNCKQIDSNKKQKRKGKKVLSKKKSDFAYNQETHDLAIISFTSSIATYLTPFLGLAFGSISVFLISGVLLATLALVWGSIANIKIGKNPNKYKGNTMTVIASMLGIIALSVLFAVYVFFVATV